MRWDPGQYARFAGPRSRPFVDLLARVGAQDPAAVVDLGCGTGELTAALAARWPGAAVGGLDSSPEMVARAPRTAGMTIRIGDVVDFDATGVDVVVSNALLQWVPTHRDLLARWAGQLPAGGWLAFQVPANFEAPSHRLMRRLAASPGWRERLDGVLRGTDSVAEPADYLALLAGCGLSVDVWQTSYLHQLTGTDPVLEWVRGTGLRPVLGALSEPDGAAFTADYAALLREAYPPSPDGVVVFPFLRTFVVGHKP